MWAVVVVLWIAEGGVTDGDGGGVGGVTAGGGGLFVDQSINNLWNSEQHTRNEQRNERRLFLCDYGEDNNNNNKYNGLYVCMYICMYIGNIRKEEVRRNTHFPVSVGCSGLARQYYCQLFKIPIASPSIARTHRRASRAPRRRIRSSRKTHKHHGIWNGQGMHALRSVASHRVFRSGSADHSVSPSFCYEASKQATQPVSTRTSYDMYFAIPQCRAEIRSRSVGCRLYIYCVRLVWYFGSDTPDGIPRAF